MKFALVAVKRDSLGRLTDSVDSRRMYDDSAWRVEQASSGWFRRDTGRVDQGRTRACGAALRPARFVSILVCIGHRAQSRREESSHVHTSLFDDCRRRNWFCDCCRTGMCRRRHRGKSADVRRMPRPEWRARRSKDHSDHLGSAAELSDEARALRRRICARSRPISRPRAGRRNVRPPLPRRRPTESPSANHATSRISRAARRRRGWQGSVTNTWSQPCATSPPRKGAITATCRNSCRR